MRRVPVRRFLVSLLVCASVAALSCGRSVRAPESDSDASEISLVNLLAHASRLNGTPVMVFGFLSYPGGIPYLFLTRDHAAVQDTSSAILLHGAKNLACPAAPAYVNGTFTLENGVAMIWPIERIRIYPSGKTFAEQCWPER